MIRIALRVTVCKPGNLYYTEIRPANQDVQVYEAGYSLGGSGEKGVSI